MVDFYLFNASETHQAESGVRNCFLDSIEINIALDRTPFPNWQIEHTLILAHNHGFVVKWVLSALRLEQVQLSTAGTESNLSRQQTVQSVCAILSSVKITSIFCSGYCLLVQPRTVLPEPYTSQYRLVTISGTTLPLLLQRSKGCHRYLRGTGCIFSKWVLPGTIIPVQGTQMALPSG